MFKNKRTVTLSILAIIILLVTATTYLYSYFAEINEIGSQYISVTITNLLAYVGSFVTLFVFTFICAFIWSRWLKKNLSDITLAETFFNKKGAVLLISLAASTLTSIFFSKEIAKDVLLALNGVSSGTLDPVFGADMSYYMLVRPLLIALRSYLNALFIGLLIYTIISYYYFVSKNNDTFSIKAIIYEKKILTHVIINILVIFIIKILGFKFTMEDLLFKGTERVGGGYTDINIWLPFYKVLPVILLLIIVFAFIFLYRSKYKALIITVAIYPLSFVLASGAAFVTQQLIVKPNEGSRESVYIKYNIDSTRKAYNLDNITESEYVLSGNLNADILSENTDIVENIRITDHSATLTAYNQLQGIRNYYQFIDADIVPYSQGDKRMASFVSVRELSDTGDLSNATYVNKHMKYTHGFGIVKSPVNKVTPEGQPDFLIKDIPLIYQQETDTITQPRIYFGEGSDEYFIVNTKQSELDFADAQSEYEYNYNGNAGIKLNMLNRLIYAVKLGDINLLTSSYIKPDSRLLINHNVLDRVRKAVPFIEFDEDIHIATDADGSLKWIVDGYTHSRHYPYAQYSQNGAFNYIRNSVKAVVDAYDGNITLYIIDENDPIISTYKKIYPSVFSSEQINDKLKEQIKYPEWLFQVQANIFTKYHITNPATFYSGSDIWAIAREKYGENAEIRNVAPYYNITSLGGEKPEFIIMIPYTLKNKDNNLVGWLCARNDGENYGKFVSYSFPIGKHAYGTLQIENKIDNDPDISREITLWSQGGSSVMRGNMIVVPINQSLVYVEPLYLTSQNEASLPEVKRIIVAYEDRIVMETSLDAAFTKLFGDFTVLPPEVTESSDIPQVNPDALELIKQEYKNLKDAASRGDWKSFGKSMDAIDAILEN